MSEFSLFEFDFHLFIYHVRSEGAHDGEWGSVAEEWLVGIYYNLIKWIIFIDILGEECIIITSFIKLPLFVWFNCFIFHLFISKHSNSNPKCAILLISCSIYEIFIRISVAEWSWAADGNWNCVILVSICVCLSQFLFRSVSVPDDYECWDFYWSINLEIYIILNVGTGGLDAGRGSLIVQSHLTYIVGCISGNTAFASNKKRYKIDYLCALRFGWKGESIHQSSCRSSIANLKLRTRRLIVQLRYNEFNGDENREFKS